MAVTTYTKIPFSPFYRSFLTVKNTSTKYAVDVTSKLAATAGNNTASLNGAIRGIVKGDTLTKTAVTTSGVHGVYWITTSTSSNWPKAAVLGEIHDASQSADGGVVSLFISGNSGVNTVANAYFTGIKQGVGGTLTYGLDLNGAVSGSTAHTFANADIRMTNNVVFMNAAGVPTNGVAGTGAGFAGPGSFYVNISTGIPYVNTNTKASPTWTKVSGT